MCGINGIFAFHYAANAVDADELRRSRDRMADRGPDGAGIYLSPDHRIGFGHRRLAIIDLSEGGAQPMTSADGRLTVTFNGEIYNHAELRAGLEAKGVVFRSRSDTEVLLHLYAAKGADLVHDLRGMFAFAIWDTSARCLLLARDPYGVKPLYYSDDGWTFRFASTVKSLLAGGAISRDPDPAGWTGFYLFGSVPEPFTTFRAIRALPAGATMTVDRTGAHAPVRYHSIAAAYRDASAESVASSGPDAARTALLESVSYHLVADVPVAAFLSAGVDSGALVGLMRDAGATDIQTVTIGFEEFRGRQDDETPLAADVAAFYGTRHTTRMVSRSEFETDLPRILDAMDQPSIDGVNTWFVAKATRELGLKVAISGLGGDEVLGGYPSFRDIPRWVRLLRAPSAIPFLGKAGRMLGRPLIDALKLNPKAAGMLELGGSYAGAYLLKRGLFMPWELRRILGADMVRDGLRRLDPLQRIRSVIDPQPASAQGCVAALEACVYMRNQLLRDTDWASMAHSIEVRVPLVDSRLLDRLAPLSARISPGEGKSILARAPSRPLPASISNRAKTGFTTPVANWMDAAMRRDAPLARRRAPRPEPWAREWSRFIAAKAMAAGV